MHEWIPLFTALVWPATVLVFAIWFRAEIHELLQSLTEAKIGSNVFKFGQALTDLVDFNVRKGRSEDSTAPTTRTTPKLTTTSSVVRLDKPTNLFWLGNDLEWTAQTVLRGAPKDGILHGLTQACFHISELGLQDSLPGKHLLALSSEVESLSEAGLERQWRNNFAEKLYSVTSEIENLLKGEQPDFRAGPN